jgi:hypothetical protein
MEAAAQPPKSGKLSTTGIRLASVCTLVSAQAVAGNPFRYCFDTSKKFSHVFGLFLVGGRSARVKVRPIWVKENLADAPARTLDAECEEVAERLGVCEALDAIDEIVDEHRSLAKRIADTPACTLKGLRVRAVILQEILDDFDEDEDATTDELMYRSIVRDLLTMTA